MTLCAIRCVSTEFCPFYLVNNLFCLVIKDIDCHNNHVWFGIGIGFTNDVFLGYESEVPCRQTKRRYNGCYSNPIRHIIDFAIYVANILYQTRSSSFH